MSTQLNREFSERDLQRMRNIISKKTADGTRIQAGYSKNKIDHIEGDTWEENGKTWTIHNGIKQTITKHDALKAMVEFPLTCPCCSKAMKDIPLNRKMYSIHSKCFDCVIEMEHKLRMSGEYEVYERNMLNSNKNATIDDAEQMFDDYFVSKKNTYVTEAGDIEKWDGGRIDPEYIKMIKANIKRLRELEI
jgi:GTP cyclohydrolase FolE2